MDEIEQVSNEEAILYARRLAREEGIISGVSCGAAVAVAVRYAQDPKYAGKTIVVILPDSGERYLSSILFDDVFDAWVQQVPWQIRGSESIRSILPNEITAKTANSSGYLMSPRNKR